MITCRKWGIWVIALFEKGSVGGDDVEGSVACGRHFDVAEWLLGRRVYDLPRNGAGSLRAQGDRPEQNRDQRGSEVTDKCHTSMPSTEVSEVPPPLDFSPYPSLERRVVKDPHFASYPAYSPRWYTFPLYR